MTINLRFVPPIPDGMRIIETELEVAGIPFRKAAALAFAKRSEHRLELEREPRNRHDPNAIRVIGISKGWFFWRRHFLGYVPKEAAARIAKAGNWNVILPRLKNIWQGGYHTDVIYIRFDILAPKPVKETGTKIRKRKDA